MRVKVIGRWVLLVSKQLGAHHKEAPGSLRQHCDGGKQAGCDVVQRLPQPPIVDGAPGITGPDVVQLPAGHGGFNIMLSHEGLS